MSQLQSYILENLLQVAISEQHFQFLGELPATWDTGGIVTMVRPSDNVVIVSKEGFRRTFL